MFFSVCFPCDIIILCLQSIQRQRIKRKKYRERRRQSKYYKRLVEEGIKRKYEQLKEKLDRERELETSRTKARRRSFLLRQKGKKD